MSSLPKQVTLVVGGNGIDRRVEAKLAPAVRRADMRKLVEVAKRRKTELAAARGTAK